MAISAGKVAPSVVVLALVGYCVWPSVLELTSAPPPPPSPVKVPELAASLFSPTMPSPPTKNPWGGMDVESLAAAKEAAKTAAKMEAAKEADKAAGASAGSAAPNKPVDLLDGLKLEATCILGNQRLAMINGQLYAPQKTPSAGNSSTPPFRVVGVFPNKALLECKGKTVELTYEGIVSQPASPPKAKSPKIAPAKTELPKTDLLDITAVGGRVTSLLKKLSAAATALQSGGKNQSGKAGD